MFINETPFLSSHKKLAGAGLLSNARRDASCFLLADTAGMGSLAAISPNR
jgi:hypothetical protein